jgi:hypothetical protein
MSHSPEGPTFPMLLEEGVHRVVRKVRLAQAVLALGLGGVLLTAAVGAIVRIKAPTDGGLAGPLTAGVLGIAALTVGLIVLRISERSVTRSPAIQDAAASYLVGCWIAGGLNLLAGAVTAIVVFANGVSNGLWLPTLLVLVLNVTGSALALPRVKHFRRMFYSPSLRCARL